MWEKLLMINTYKSYKEEHTDLPSQKLITRLEALIKNARGYTPPRNALRMFIKTFRLILDGKTFEHHKQQHSSYNKSKDIYAQDSSQILSMILRNKTPHNTMQVLLDCLRNCPAFNDARTT